MGKKYCFCYIRRFMQLCFSGSGCTSMTSRALNWMRRWQLWPRHSSGGRAMGWRTWMTQLWTGFFESHQGSCKRRNGKGFKFDKKNYHFMFYIGKNILTLQIFRDLLDKGAFFRCKLNLCNTNIMICFIWFTYIYVLLVFAIRNEI